MSPIHVLRIEHFERTVSSRYQPDNEVRTFPMGPFRRDNDYDIDDLHSAHTMPTPVEVGLIAKRFEYVPRVFGFVREVQYITPEDWNTLTANGHVLHTYMCPPGTVKFGTDNQVLFDYESALRCD